ncbi:LPS export ABC transporter periplasmic protein LptC [Thalassotalea mangrovi]|uniref:Lipopolysaccharide export system protein LptC n=1 Tax=Thalassotalea mangrovi TaxID=2572245 RepID=A0A4U1BBD3_9GAMM|nr:LPS export ABC transporter periplasmic protein LptC [Thalassotalea mangrovi]TKB47892.1 LPS export ABC transporter periplasmic protein LptC [Thalassotalea mangrovi]
MTRLHTISTVIFAVALAIYGYIQWQNANTLDALMATDEELPEFIASDLRTSRFDADGNLTHTIYAQQMQHYADSEETLFQYPSYTLYPNDGTTPWNISANNGKLIANRELILERRVRAVAEQQDNFISEIHSKALQLDLINNTISSEQTIMIKGRDFTMYGSGLFVDIDTTKMTINEHVQTIYKTQ